ncbi:Hpt domain-containing protein, partial [Pseudomonas edaphica]
PITGGNPAIIQQLQAELMRSNQQDIEQLRDFSETRDLAGIAQLAHRLRGSAALMCNDYLLELCKELEHGCRTGAEDVPAQVRQVKKELRRIQHMLEP